MTISGEVNVRQGISGDLQMPRIVGGGSITVDSELSSTSENPVQNKVIKSALDGKGTYSKPSGGIPKTDLASTVQTSLGKADTALQEHQSLNGYATETWVTNQGYLTEHQDVSGKANTTSVPASASVDANGLISFKNADNTQLFTVQLPLYAGGVD